MSTSWTLDSLREAVKQQLLAQDYDAFHSATGTSIAQLCEMIGRTPRDSLPSLLANLTSTTKVIYPHPLNAFGLHPFRGLMAERLSDAVRAASNTNHTSSHAAHEDELVGRFRRQGFLVLPLHRLPSGLAAVGRRARLDPALHLLLRRLSGWRQGSWLQGSSTPLQALTHVDGDIQHYAHVDTHTQCLKAFVWAPGTHVGSGPLHYVNGSHRSTPGKLRWLFERTRHLTGTGPLPRRASSALIDTSLGPRLPFSDWTHGFHTSIRVEGFVPDGPPATIREAMDAVDFGRYGFAPPVPMLLPPAELHQGRATLVVADTSGWHYRGFAPNGSIRVAARFHSMKDNRQNAWRCYQLLGTTSAC